ncbi:MAG: M3 family peptidase [Alphaproteobacteria bacterium]|nr:M3 family peptidase [Alphaproteobacteria bacterium]
MSENPLLTVSPLPNKAPPFDRIKDEHYLPAIRAGIEEARANINALKTNEAEPDFENTVAALEGASETLSTALSIFYSQLSANGSDAMQKIAEEIGPLSAAFSSEVAQDPAVFARVKAVWDKRDTLDLTPEQSMVLEDSYKGFVRGGALLNDEDKKRLTAINERQSVLGPAFMNNTKKAIEAFELVIEDRSELAGMPDNAIQMAADNARERDMEGKYVITLDMPMYIPVIQYADNRDLREKVWRAYASRAWKDAFDNSENCLEIVRLRHERARLLGYETHAAFVLERRMAEKPETVLAFIDALRDTYKPKAQQDLERLKQYARDNGGPIELRPWDVGYYSEKLRQKLFDFSSEDLRPYFPLENVLTGAFAHFGKLFNLRFEETDAYPLYHKDVVAYDIFDDGNGRFLGTFYGDFYPRKGKKDGAWMTSYRDQGLYHGTVERPVVAICCNFPKPSGDTPSLLSHDEVTTLFHEMGHAMHALLSDVTYSSVAGTNVLWDFVELPSQVQENWAYSKETLDLFARHYQTGESIPEGLVKKLNKAKNFMVAWSGLRQIAFCTLDMAWHDRDPSSIEDPARFEDTALAGVTLFPRLAGPISTGFNHIFAGGYSAGYYSYKWAEVLDADTFELFEKKGIYDRATADAYKEQILAKGGSEHPKVLYRNFRGRDADPNALLRREGLLKK